MSDKRRRDEYQMRRELQDSGFRVRQDDSVEFNHGSETLMHYQTKCAAAWVLREKDYRVSSEVETPDGEADLVGYAGPDNDCIVVECETSPTEDVVKRKLDQFVHGTPVRDMFLLTVNDAPENMPETVEWVREQL